MRSFITCIWNLTLQTAEAQIILMWSIFVILLHSSITAEHSFLSSGVNSHLTLVLSRANVPVLLHTSRIVKTTKMQPSVSSPHPHLCASLYQELRKSKKSKLQIMYFPVNPSSLSFLLYKRSKNQLQ